MTRLPDPTFRSAAPRPAGLTGLADQFGVVARELRVQDNDRFHLGCT
jgi:cyclic pyranopterin phosphate synthase